MGKAKRETIPTEKKHKSKVKKLKTPTIEEQIDDANFSGGSSSGIDIFSVKSKRLDSQPDSATVLLQNGEMKNMDSSLKEAGSRSKTKSEATTSFTHTPAPVEKRKSKALVRENDSNKVYEITRSGDYQPAGKTDISYDKLVGVLKPLKVPGDTDPSKPLKRIFSKTKSENISQLAISSNHERSNESVNATEDVIDFEELEMLLVESKDSEPLENDDWLYGRGVKSVEGESRVLDVSSGFLWDEKKITTALHLKNHERNSDDSETEEKKVLPSKKVKRNRFVEAMREENELYKTEYMLMDPDRLPESIDDFERMILSSPNSSLVWLKYMAFYLQSAEFDKARTVAERALKTISFSEEQEKLNIWAAMLNLENTYGSPTSLHDVFNRALQYNEPVNVYRQLVTIYENTNKIEDAANLYIKMIKKFRSKEMYVEYGTFLMKHSRFETAQKILEGALAILNKKEHIDVIVKFALLEFIYGDQQRGRSLFESIVNNYPNRTDILTVYTNQLIKSGDFAGTRLVFERATTMLNLKSKVMMLLFKKYLHFEKDHGTDANVEQVINKMKQYIKKGDDG